MGDGELNEGAVWEAAIFASQHKLANLIAIVDHNKMQAMGHTKDIVDLEPLKGKWEAFGWYVQDIDGHDFAAIFKSFGRLSKSRPNLIVMHTMKGKGVSFMENDILWHYRYPRDEEYTNALKELYR
jgi:transketolase